MGLLVAFSGGQGDLLVGESGLELDQGLSSLVLVSLLSDARARPEDLAANGESERYRDLRGWWADSEEDRFGSRLWLLERCTQSQQNLVRAEDYAREALQWLVRDGILERVEATASWVSRGHLRLAVRLVRGRARQWAQLFEQPVAGVFQVGPLSLEVS